MNLEKVIICAVCRAPKPAHFLVCDVCWAEVPEPLKLKYWNAKGHHHHNPQEWAAPFTRIMQQIISHLKQHGSALA